jgi:molybdenum cofactor biosynthesis protein B
MSDFSASVEQHREAAPDVVRCAILTVSDTRTTETDTSGQIVRQHLSWRGHQIVAYEIVPDDAERIGALLDEWIARGDIQAIVTNGGTGIAQRDTTFDAIDGRLDKRLDGFGEIFRMLSYQQIGAAAMLSRAVAGVCGSTVIFCTPGSANAVKLAMESLIAPEIAHVVYELTKL